MIGGLTTAKKMRTYTMLAALVCLLKVKDTWAAGEDFSNLTYGDSVFVYAGDKQKAYKGRICKRADVIKENEKENSEKLIEKTGFGIQFQDGSRIEMPPKESYVERNEHTKDGPKVLSKDQDPIRKLDWKNYTVKARHVVPISDDKFMKPLPLEKLVDDIQEAINKELAVVDKQIEDKRAAIDQIKSAAKKNANVVVTIDSDEDSEELLSTEDKAMIKSIEEEIYSMEKYKSDKYRPAGSIADELTKLGATSEEGVIDGPVTDRKIEAEYEWKTNWSLTIPTWIVYGGSATSIGFGVVEAIHGNYLFGGLLMGGGALLSLGWMIMLCCRARGDLNLKRGVCCAQNAFAFKGFRAH